MAKKKKEEKKKHKKESTEAAESPTKKKKSRKNDEDNNMITLEALDAMSDSDDDDAIPEALLNAKAKNLRQAISEGKFDGLIEKLNKKKASSNDNDNDEDSESEMEEIEMSDGNSSNSDNDDVEDKIESSKIENIEEEEDEDDNDDDDHASDDSEEAVEGNGKKSEQVANEDDSDSESSNDSEEEEEEEEGHNKIRQMEENNRASSMALSIVASELVKAHAIFPFAETFDVVPTTPLPFTTANRNRKIEDDDDDDEEEEEEIVDIHDDLKREVAFYNNALEAVHEARSRCDKHNIPFSRPEDFFAEMVKTDDHMAKVKDKLIFETKKMDAVAQRKANRENKLRARESQANRLAEKAKKKKDHFKNVEEWANNAANNRGGALRDDLDDMYLNNRSTSKKRQAADRKYGFGGKRGRFKQNDRATLNDVSGFNPRGNFAGGMKKSAKSGGRQGKRARDAKRARQN